MQVSGLNKLEELLQSDLPGWQAHKAMSPLGTRIMPAELSTVKKAAVLALLYPGKRQDLSIVYIKRPDFDKRDKHGGQVSFPGGRMEVVDKNLEQTALRETHEEIGVIPSDIEIIGNLSQLYVPVSNFLIQPFVAFIEYQPEFKPEKSEVNYIITEKISTLLQPDKISRKHLNIRGDMLLDVPYFKLGDETLWGATAMITSELVHLIRKL